MLKDFHIAGVQPISLLEKPGEIAMLVFTQGCSFRCPFCHNPELIPLKNKKVVSYPLEEFFKLLEERKNWIDLVIITGGEPTLQKDLPNFLKEIKKRGLKTGIHTNGGNPVVLKKLISEELVNYITMDLKNSFSKYSKSIGIKDFKLSLIKESLKIIKESLNKKQSKVKEVIFRTTIIPSLVLEEDLEKIKTIIPKGAQWELQQFRPMKCFDKKYEKLKPISDEEFHRLLKHFNR